MHWFPSCTLLPLRSVADTAGKLCRPTSDAPIHFTKCRVVKLPHVIFAYVLRTFCNTRSAHLLSGQPFYHRGSSIFFDCSCPESTDKCVVWWKSVPLMPVVQPFCRSEDIQQSLFLLKFLPEPFLLLLHGLLCNRSLHSFLPATAYGILKIVFRTDTDTIAPMTVA